MKDPKPFSVFVAQISQAKRPAYGSPFEAARDAEALRSIARRLDQIHVNQCNGYQRFDVKLGYNVEDTDRATREEIRERLLRKQAVEIAARYEFAVHFQDDPRGLPLYLGYAPHMTENNYSTHGIGVPV